MEKVTNSLGVVHTKDYFYDVNQFLFRTIEQGNGITKTTDFAADGTSSGKNVSSDGSYELFFNGLQTKHSQFYASDGHLDHESTNSTSGSDTIYYGSDGKIIREEHADFFGATSKYYHSDGSYEEHYGGANGRYDKKYDTNGTLVHSVGNDVKGSSWDITYDANGRELINKWSKAGIEDGEIDHNSDGSVVEMIKSTSGKIVFSTTSTNGLKAQALVGSYASDHLVADGAVNFVAGSSGNDLIELGSGRNIVAYNIGDGRDTITSTGGGAGVLSLGGGINYDMIRLAKVNSDLVLSFWGQTEAVVLKDWYSNGSSPAISKLQLVLSKSDIVPTDPVLSQKFQEFDFSLLVQKFDQARTSDSTLTSWKAAEQLHETLLYSGNNGCIGGYLASQYADMYHVNVSLIGTSAVLLDSGFGDTPQ